MSLFEDKKMIQPFILFKKISSFFFKHSQEGSCDALISRGRLIDTGHSYRLLIWVSRLFGFGLLVSLLINIINGFLLWNLFPLKQSIPFFVTLSPKSEQIILIEPINMKTNGFDIMTESLARHYVKLRESFDFQTESQRWREVYWLSTPEIFEHFKHLMNNTQNGVYEARKSKKYYRNVTILSVSTLSKDPCIIQVEWSSQDYCQGDSSLRNHWISTLSIGYSPQNVKFEDRFMNPLGFTVMAYNVSEKISENLSGEVP